MNDKRFIYDVRCSSWDDFVQSYPPCARFTRSDRKVFFNVIVTPKAFIRMSVVSDLGFVAALGIAEQYSIVVKNAGIRLDRYAKQFIGAVVCCLMEHNDCVKTGCRKSINHPDFTKGEIYER